MSDRLSTQHEADEDLLKPLKIASLISHRPCLVYWVTLALTLILGAIDTTVFELNLEQHPRRLLVETSIYSIWFDAWTLAEEHNDQANTDTSSNTTFSPQTEEVSDWTTFMMFEMTDYSNNKNDWILTPTNLETIIKYEEKVTKNDKWNDYYCFVKDTDSYQCNYFSLAERIMKNWNYDTNSFTTDDVISYVWELYNGGSLTNLIEASFDGRYGNANKTKYYRSFLTGGGPVPNKILMEGNGTVVKTSKYEDIDDDYDSQELDFLNDYGLDIFKEIIVDNDAELEEGNLRIGVMIFSAWTDYLFQLFFGSVPFIGMAMVAVIFWMTIHTQSLFLSCLGIIGIMLSFPFGYFIYAFIYQIRYFDFLSALIIFVLLGVGADDIFVFTDAWHQSIHFVRDPMDDEQRMTFAYRRASKAMFVTQITTFFAFLATASSSLLPLSAFGYWASLIVAANYVLVITMYPSVLMMHHKYFKKCESKYLCCCFHTGCPCCNNDSSSNDSNNDPDFHRRGSEAPHETKRMKSEKDGDDNTAKDTTDKEIELAPGGNESKKQPKSSGESQTATDKNDIDDHQSSPAQLRRQKSLEQADDYRAVERFCGVTWTEFIIKFKYFVLLGFIGIIGISIYLMITGLEPLDEAEESFKSEHYMQKTLNFVSKFGAGEDDGLGEVIVAWGIKGVDRDGSDRYDMDEYGKIKWDHNFDMSSPEAQWFMYTTCVNLSESDIVFSKESVICPLNDLVNYTLSNNDSSLIFPWVYLDPNNDNYDPDIQKDLFAEYLYNFSISEYASDGWEYVYIRTPDETHGGNYHIRYYAIYSQLDLTFTSSRTERNNRRDDWDKWLDNTYRKNKNCPDNVCKPIQSSTTWTFIESQNALITSALQGIGIALPLAFMIMIFSTRNWIIASFATIDIIGVMACGLSTIAVAGWQFGTGESVSIVMMIGFSVDYVVHLANAYLECPGEKREERLSFCLLTMGVSVASGAITTFLAGIFLLFPSFLIFYKMGVMLLATIFFSVLWAFFFFAALLAAFGPQGNTGNIPFGKWIAKCKESCNKD